MQLVAEHLDIDRGGRSIVRDLSFTLKAGEALTLWGSNGAGKTTVLRALAGLLPLAGGRLRLEGGAAGGDADPDPDREMAQSCHYVGHATPVKNNLTVAGNLAFWATYLGGADASAARASTVAAALAKVGLESLGALPAGVLSAGQKRRLGLARLFAAHRPLWLLDEPTVSLDGQSVADLTRLINAHTGAGGLAVIATHGALGLENSRELRLGGGEG